MQSKSVCLNYCCWSRIELGLLLLLEFNGVLHKLFIKVKEKEIRLSYPSVCTLVPEEAEDFFFYQNTVLYSVPIFLELVPFRSIQL